MLLHIVDNACQTPQYTPQRSVTQPSPLSESETSVPWTPASSCPTTPRSSQPSPRSAAPPPSHLNPPPLARAPHRFLEGSPSPTQEATRKARGARQVAWPGPVPGTGRGAVGWSLLRGQNLWRQRVARGCGAAATLPTRKGRVRWRK